MSDRSEFLALMAEVEAAKESLDKINDGIGKLLDEITALEVKIITEEHKQWFEDNPIYPPDYIKTKIELRRWYRKVAGAVPPNWKDRPAVRIKDHGNDNAKGG